VIDVEPAPRRAGRAVMWLPTVVLTARRWVFRLAVVAALAAAFLVYAIVRDGFPAGADGVLAVLGIAAAVFPPTMLAAFYIALGELVRFPERMRRLPLDAREHGDQLRAIVDEARIASGRRLRIMRTLWRTVRTTNSARETFTPYAPLLPLVSVPFLAGTAVAALAAAVEIAVACVVAVALLT
jgi:hypothetical protein